MKSRIMKRDDSVKILTKLFRRVTYNETTKVLTVQKHDQTTQTITIT